jgi:hypothetical protein
MHDRPRARDNQTDASSAKVEAGHSLNRLSQSASAAVKAVNYFVNVEAADYIMLRLV